MKTFEVRLTRTTIHTALVLVQAHDEESAADKACDKAENSSKGIDWELDNESYEADDVEQTDEDSDE